jgi:hypothetical protein
MKITLSLSAAAVALLMTALGAPAFAQFSDTLTVGSGVGGVGGGTFNVLESKEPGGAVSTHIPIAESGQNITGSLSIFLTEGTTTAVSDIVTATITGTTDSPTGFFLSVVLTSDGEVPLTPAVTAFEMIPETGAVQDLTSDFNAQFDLNTSLPTIQVTSDIGGIPEPSTWAMMLVGFAGLAFAGYRARRSAAAASL